MGMGVFYQYDQNYLRSKEQKNDVIIIDEDRAKKLPHLNPENAEKDYSIMFYFTEKLLLSNDFGNSFHTIREYFEELVQKTNLEYQNRNISIRAHLHCFEMAVVRDNHTSEVHKFVPPFSEDRSDKMSVILEKFKSM